jgi:hypothetical protein
VNGDEERNVHYKYLSPFSASNPRLRVQFGQGAVLQQFAKPTPLFEHENDFDAPGEHPSTRYADAIRTWRSAPTLRQPNPTFEHEDEHEHEDDFDAPGEGEYFLDRYLGLKPQAQSFHPRPQRSRSDAGWAFGINPSSPFGSDSRFLPRRPSYPAR